MKRPALTLLALSAALRSANTLAQSSAPSDAVANPYTAGATTTVAPAIASSPAPTDVPVQSEPPTPRPLSPPIMPTVPPAATVVPAVAVAEAPFVLQAGWHNDLFYLSDARQNFFLVPSGRLQLDAFAYVGDRVMDAYPVGRTLHPADVQPGFVLRRARLEVAGGFLDRFTYMIAGEFDNSTTPIATDLIFNARIAPALNLQLGQYDAPFTMENRTSDKYFDFMERSLAVRALGVPTNKEIGLMAWGEEARRLVYYSIGIFNGDGQNRITRYGDFDVIGRAFAHPLITTSNLLRNLQIGGSFRYGWRTPSVDYLYPNMTTQTGWKFFNSALAGGAQPISMVPNGEQWALAGEIDLPIDRVDLRGEFVYVHNGTAEMSAAATDTANLVGAAQRLGQLDGYAWYAQLGFWPIGTPGVNGRPGYENPPALRLNQPDPVTPPQGLQIVARLEGLEVHYRGGVHGAVSTTAGHPGSDGRYAVYAIDLGLNYWATRHVRFSINYLEYVFPDQPGMMALPNDNHAHGPHGNAFDFGEVTTRVGLAL